MPTLTTDRGDEIHVIAKMADRLWRMPPDRRANYLAAPRRRLDAGRISKDDAAAVFAAGG